VLDLDNLDSPLIEGEQHTEHHNRGGDHNLDPPVGDIFSKHKQESQRNSSQKEKADVESLHVTFPVEAKTVQQSLTSWVIFVSLSHELIFFVNVFLSSLKSLTFFNWASFQDLCVLESHRVLDPLRLF